MSVAPADGALLWRVPWRTSYDVNAAMPIFIPPDGVFISSSYDTGGALYRIKGGGAGMQAEEIWRSRVLKNHFNSSVLYQGHLYGFDDATLKCVDARTGEEKWAARGFGKGSLLVADGHLVILGERGQLALAPAVPGGYQEKARTQPLEGKTWTMPTLSNGRLYLRNEAELVALDVKG
jgi:outer membrane protein assembly factor BamB